MVSDEMLYLMMNKKDWRRNRVENTLLSIKIKSLLPEKQYTKSMREPEK